MNNEKLYRPWFELSDDRLLTQHNRKVDGIQFKGFQYVKIYSNFNDKLLNWLKLRTVVGTWEDYNKLFNN